jgi:hypothetical protein
LEQRRIGKSDILTETAFSMFNQKTVSPVEAGRLLDIGIFFLQSRGHGGRRAPCPTFSFIPGPVADDPEYVFRTLMEPVIAPFVIDPEEDEKTGRHSYSQSGDIDEGITSVASDVPKGRDDVVAYHDRFSCDFHF